jgi:hypothetical protein
MAIWGHAYAYSTGPAEFIQPFPHALEYVSARAHRLGNSSAWRRNPKNPRINCIHFKALVIIIINEDKRFFKIGVKMKSLPNVQDE